MLKPHLVSIKKQTEKSHSAVKEIIKDVDIDNDVEYTEEYSLSEESISSNSEEEKASASIKINMSLNDYKKGHVLGNGNCLFAFLDKLVFNDSFGSFSLRQLIVDHISDNKELYADDVEDDFDQYMKKMRNNCEWGGIVELLEFSSMIDLKFELWTNIKDSARYLTIGYVNNPNDIKLLYTNWCHYSPLIPSSNDSFLPKKKNEVNKKKIDFDVAGYIAERFRYSNEQIRSAWIDIKKY